MKFDDENIKSDVKNPIDMGNKKITGLQDPLQHKDGATTSNVKNPIDMGNKKNNQLTRSSSSQRWSNKILH